MTTTLGQPRVAGSERYDGRRPDDPGRRTRAGRVLRGRTDDPAWVRPALLVLLVATGVLYFWDLSASGWANSFYSAAAQAGSASWKAFLFGSSDAANSITVDKPPASLWPMALSVRIFGLSSWSILAPQALIGVATVGVLYASVRRRFSAGAGLLAGAVLALTPVAALMFRFNNPDALLVLLLTGAAYAVLRACENARTRWMIAAGVLVGFAFLTKQMQAFLVLPAFGLTYLIAAPVSVGRRIRDLLAAFAAMIVSAGWWIALVELWPASSRPYIGGSQTNSILELTFGYNGFGRLTGNETGSVGGGGAGGNQGGGMRGATGLFRLFGAEFGGQVMWLVPAALILLAAGLALTWRRPRTSATRAAFVLWGSWLVITLLVFSFMKGIFHAYYTVALAPATAALVGIGAVWLWQRHDVLGRWILAGATLVTTFWAFTLLTRSDAFLPWLRPLILVAGGLAALGLAAGAVLGRRVVAVAAAAALFAGLAGPTAYALQTAGTGHSGSIVSAGPTVAGALGGPGGMGGPGGGRGGFGGPPPGFSPGQAQGATGTQAQGGMRGGMGGLLNGTAPSAELTAALVANASSYTWVAAAIGSNNASGYQLAAQKPVMAIGGFNGSDPSPALAQFQAYVAAGQIHYFIASGIGGNNPGGSNASSHISAWVQENFTAMTIGGTSVYDLS